MSTALRQRLSTRLVDSRRRRSGAVHAGSEVAETGFVLLEEIVSITLLMIVMAALATFFLTVTQSTTYERARQSAVQLANTEMGAVDAVSSGDLYLGRTQQAVSAQFAAAPPTVAAALQTTQQAYDTSTPTSTLTLPMTTTAVANAITYTVSNYLGNCWIPTVATLGTACTNTVAAIAAGIPYVRAVVSVTWPGNHCPQVNGVGLCSYVTSGLLSAQGDPTFNLCTLGAACGPAPPQLINPGNQVSLVGSSVSLQLALKSNSGIAPISWSTSVQSGGQTVDTLPTWLHLNYSTGLITGTAPAAPATAVTVTVTATDAFARTTQTSFTWTVVAPPTITGLTSPYTATAGAPIAAQALPYTCPTSSCTYTLGGAPSGIGLATASGGTGAAKQTVTNTSGTLYLVGTVAASIAPSSTAYAADIASQGASDYWRLDETSGTIGADSGAGATNAPLTEQPGVGHGVAGALLATPDAASTFDGAADGAASTTTAITGPQTFSEDIWFKTTTTQGGKLMGFGTSTAANGLSGGADRQLYLDNAGHLDFGVYNNGYEVLPTTGTYNDGQWHQAVATLSSAGANLYVDGVNVASNPAWTVAAQYAGYWRIGGDNLSGWPNQPTSNFVAGTLDEAAVFPTALTPAQIQQQYVDSGRVPYTVTATPTDQVTGASGVVDQASWMVNPVAPPTVTGLTDPLITTAGAALTPQRLTYTCPTSSCTETLTGAPSGIGVATSSAGPFVASVTVAGDGSSALFLGGVVDSTTAGNVTTANTYSGDVVSQGAGDVWHLGETSGTTAVDSVGNLPLTEYGGVGHGAAGAIVSSPGTATTFDGSTGYAVAQTSVAAPSVFTQSIWFKTTSTTGGFISGMSGPNGLNSYDRQLWMDNAGHLWYGVYPYTVKTVNTPGTYNDGQWHEAVVTLSGAGLSLYVDGISRASDPTVTSSPSYAGYWRLGLGNLAGWGSTTSSSYFAGTLDEFAVYPTTSLTASQIQQQYADSGRTAAYTLAVTPVSAATSTSSTVTGLANTASWTVNPAPTVSGLTTPFTTTVGAKIVAQSLAYTCPTTSCSYSVSGVPAGVGLSLAAGGTASSSVSVSGASGAIYLVGTVGAGVTAGNFTVTVTPTDIASGVNGTAVTAAWTVYAAPSASGLAAVRTTVGATITPQSLTYSCPAGSCTVTLTGAPSGVGLSSTANGSPQSSVAVTATGGPLYLVGTVGAGVSPGAFSLTLSTQDAASQVRGTATATMTVFAAPTITGLTNPVRTNAGVAVSPQTLSDTCPIASCTYTVTGGVTGIGLSTTSTGAAAPSVSVSATSGALYLVGTPTAVGTFTLTVTGSSSGVNGAATTASWIVNAVPTVTGLTNPFPTTVGATVSQTLSYSCPSTACTLTVTGMPTGIGLDTDNVGAVASTLSVTGPSSGTSYLRGTVGAGTTGTYSVVLTPRDTVNNLTGAAIGATWTVYAAPTVNGLVTPFTTTAGAALVSQNLPFTCPSSSCTYSLAGAPSGIGLATTTGGTTSASQTVATTSGTLYLRGTIAGSAINSTAYAADVPAQGASHWWRLGEASGTTAADSISGSPLPLTEFGTVGHGAAGAVATNTDTASTFDGSSGYAVAQSTVAAPSVFSESVWFKTTTTSGGFIAGLGLDPNGASNEDRLIYMNNNGQLTFGVFSSSAIRVVTSPGAYNDGNWHQVVGTVSSSGFSLAIDGSTVATDTTLTSDNNSFSGYWRLGVGSLSAWPGTHTSNFFAGSLDEFSVYNTPLSTAQLQKQYTDANAAAYSLVVSSVDSNTGVAGTSSQASWTVNPPPGIAGLTTPLRTSVGATIANDSLNYTCPSANCTYAVNNAPSGIGLSPDTVTAPAATVTVSSTAGTIYLRGTINSSTAAGSRTVTVTSTDNTASPAFAGGTAPSAWTLVAAMNLTAPAPLTVARGILASKSFTYTCQTTSCTVSVTGAPIGTGLSTVALVGTVANSLSVNAGSGTLYLQGLVALTDPPGAYPITLTLTDPAGSTITSTVTWTVT